MNIETIANQLKNLNERIVLIYAFNATGKTQLSVAYKNATKDPGTGDHAGVYYNAFSEDLFVWDNDEENENQNICLRILPSSLNTLYSFLYNDFDPIMDKLALYEPGYRFRFNPHSDIERGIESVTFYKEGNEDVPIKISRSEERIFVWCFFLGLLEVDGWADRQDAHIFIDDPVSSLDEHNIYITADTIIQQIEKHYDSTKRIIVTTHHIGLFSILANRLTKGERSGRYEPLTSLRILKRVSEGLALETPRQNVLLYHLHLLQVLDEASQNQLYTYHFAMLRQLLENIASFLGTGNISYTLNKIGINDTDSASARINSHTHKNAYYYQTEMMSDTEQIFFKDILEKINQKYQFYIS